MVNKVKSSSNNNLILITSWWRSENMNSLWAFWHCRISILTRVCVCVCVHQAEEQLRIVEEQRKIHEERMKLDQDRQRQQKEEQKMILGKGKSRPKLSFSLKATE